MFLHGSLEDITFSFVELRDALSMLEELIIAPRVQEGNCDDLCKRRNLEVGGSGLRKRRERNK